MSSERYCLYCGGEIPKNTGSVVGPVEACGRKEILQSKSKARINNGMGTQGATGYDVHDPGFSPDCDQARTGF